MATDVSIITPVIAKRNGLAWFEVIISGWGQIKDPNGISAQNYSLPKDLALTGIEIGPLSTVGEVGVDLDYAPLINRGPSAPPLTGRAVESITGGKSAGAMYTIQAQVSSDRPYVGFIPPGGIVTARNQTLWSQANGFVGEDGARHSISPQEKVDPILHLICYIEAPGPVAGPGRRVPLVASKRVIGNTFTGGSLYQNAYALPIGGRKHVSCVIAAVPSKAGAVGGVLRVRASVLRGGMVEEGGLDPIPLNEESQLFEEQVTAGAAPSGVDITSGGAVNHVRFNLDNPGAQWLLLFSDKTAPGGPGGNNVDLAYTIRATD